MYEQTCQRCGAGYDDGSSDPRCPKCRDMFQGLKNGDGKRDFVDAEHDIHPDDNYDEEIREIDLMEQQLGRRF